MKGLFPACPEICLLSGIVAFFPEFSRIPVCIVAGWWRTAALPVGVYPACVVKGLFPAYPETCLLARIIAFPPVHFLFSACFASDRIILPSCP